MKINRSIGLLLQVLVDLIFATIGLVVLILPAVAVINELLGHPAPQTELNIGIVVLALLISPLFAAQYYSLNQLGKAIGILIYTMLGLASISAIIIYLTDTDIPSAGSIVLRGSVVFVSYCLTIYLMRLGTSGNRITSKLPFV